MVTRLLLLVMKLMYQTETRLCEYQTSLQVVPFVDCCVSLLERPDLLPSPLAQSRIVSVLLAFVSSDMKGRNSQ